MTEGARSRRTLLIPAALLLLPVFLFAALGAAALASAWSDGGDEFGNLLALYIAAPLFVPLPAIGLAWLLVGLLRGGPLRRDPLAWLLWCLALTASLGSLVLATLAWTNAGGVTGKTIGVLLAILGLVGIGACAVVLLRRPSAGAPGRARGANQGIEQNARM